MCLLNTKCVAILLWKYTGSLVPLSTITELEWWNGIMDLFFKTLLIFYLIQIHSLYLHVNIYELPVSCILPLHVCA